MFVFSSTYNAKCDEATQALADVLIQARRARSAEVVCEGLRREHAKYQEAVAIDLKSKIDTIAELQFDNDQLHNDNTNQAATIDNLIAKLEAATAAKKSRKKK